MARYVPRYIDIGINLTDSVFRGVYHGKRKHVDDLAAVVGRAGDVGCSKLIVTGSDLQSSRDALDLAQQYPGTVFTTIGIHPCSSAVFGKPHAAKEDDSAAESHSDAFAVAPKHEPCSEKTTRIISDLRSLLSAARERHAVSRGLVAYGEFGLDYDRLHYCSKDVQRHSFAAQLALAASLNPQLPLFLHSRAAHRDFVSLLKAQFGEELESMTMGGVVHSFTGTVEEMKELIDLGLYIGVNGCSLKTQGNCAVVQALDLDRIMLETDGPWCEVRPSHAGWEHLALHKNNPKLIDMVEKDPATAATSHPPPQNGWPSKELKIFQRFPAVKKERWVEGAMVKGRNEPCMIEIVAQIVAGIKGVDIKTVCEAAWENTVRVFGFE